MENSIKPQRNINSALCSAYISVKSMGEKFGIDNQQEQIKNYAQINGLTLEKQGSQKVNQF